MSQFSLACHLATFLLRCVRLQKDKAKENLALSLCHLFNEVCEVTERWPSDKIKENSDTSISVM